ncbi:chorismate mutase [Streptococcus pneumoniae]
MDLEKIRQEIDQVDKDLVALLEKRMDLVSQVVAYKAKVGKAVLDSKREEEVLEKVAERVENKDYQERLVATFEAIMKESRAYQASVLERKK